MVRNEGIVSDSSHLVLQADFHERAAVSLLQLGLLVSIPPSFGARYQVEPSLTTENKQRPSPLLRRVAQPMMLDCVDIIEQAKQNTFLYKGTFTSVQGIVSESPANGLWPCTPDSFEGGGERGYCPTLTPSMLWPATPMAWPAMKTGMHVFSPCGILEKSCNATGLVGMVTC